MNANYGNPVNDVEMEELRTQILALNKSGLSWNDLKDESGIPPGTLSAWAADKYKGDNWNVALRVRQYLDKRATRNEIRGKAPDAPSFVFTPTAETIIRRIKYAHALNDFALIAGGPGIGKTACFTQYRSTVPQVYVVTGSPSVSGVQPVLLEFVEALRIEKGRGTPQALSRAISDRITGTDSLLIVDEAQHLTDKAIEEMRSIHDRAGCALVLGGNEDLYARFAGNSQRNVHAQVRSRIGSKVTVLKPSHEDVSVLASAWGITDPNALETLRKVASTPGALRGVTKVLRLASMLIDEEDGETRVSNQHIKSAWAQLSISAGAAS